jgi:hypothetical protein
MRDTRDVCNREASKHISLTASHRARDQQQLVPSCNRLKLKDAFNRAVT